MSDLIIIGYDDEQQARRAYEQVLALQDSFIVELRGLAIVTVDADGKTHVDTPQRIVARTAVSGAVFGLLFGVLFLVPGLGLLGGALGALFGKLSQSGIDRSFRAHVDEMLQPGHSAVVLMASKVTEDKFTAAMRPFGGEVLKTSLTEAAERELAEAMTGPGA
ncbi:MAG: DUF1269 domain-containing protein [Streptosporangiales bacterium]|nr:DUF1269 domain-containing protein [Streptosporangiales bacterium]MBO0889686.1 DUF1269 domain-containing protein [Acidothermales bacterium]